MLGETDYPCMYDDVVGAVTIVVGVVLLAKHIPVWGGSALPIVGAGTAPLLLGLYQLFAARQYHRGSSNPYRHSGSNPTAEEMYHFVKAAGWGTAGCPHGLSNCLVTVPSHRETELGN
ncbi:hypothetical protein AB0F43_20665 [Kribbella sp. NPDC023972]|uniref:hypothetical protein n=1 Tax=Kribbella sp. NPDC023972 TaxID=3154795 RepID=UPI0033EFDA9C